MRKEEGGMWSEITPSFEKQVHNALKGQQQPAQGSALGGEKREQANALQGQKHYYSSMLLL